MSAVIPRRTGTGGATASTSIRSIRSAAVGAASRLLATWKNPSLFTLNRNGTRLYSVHGGRHSISAFAIDRQSGMLTLLNQADCQGNNPVDLALDPTERFLVIANYGTGVVAVMPLNENGKVLSVRQLVPLHGTPGPNPKEQASSHPHAVIFDPTGTFVIVPDKGFDRTFFFRFREGRLTATQRDYADAAPGAGPRHTTFHPALPVLYVNNELDFDRDGVRLVGGNGGRAAGDLDLGEGSYGAKYNRRNRGVALWAPPIRLEPRPGQYRAVRHHAWQRVADLCGHGFHRRPDAAVFRPRPGCEPPLRGEPGQ